LKNLTITFTSIGESCNHSYMVELLFCLIKWLNIIAFLYLWIAKILYCMVGKIIWQLVWSSVNIFFCECKICTFLLEHIKLVCSA
jgi:hypothetical protein